jgi:antitoxin component of MazEF toxin-antitoxin module
MAHHAAPAGADLLKEVERLAGEGYGKGDIAERLGFRNLSTFSGRLVRASQQTGKPVPVFRARSRATARRRVDIVQVKPRGRGDSFGVNVPQEPLERLGAKPGDRLAVTVGRRRVVLAVANAAVRKAAQTPAGPRLVKNRKRR